MSNDPRVPVRLDKWLWAARFYKTRALAREMTQGGKVHYNQQRCKPSRNVDVGARITLWQGHERKEVEVMSLNDKRGPASAAQVLYQETPDSLAKRVLQAEQRKSQPQIIASDKRPDKKQRRQILQFKQNN